MADQFKKLSDIDYSTVTKDKLNSYYRAAVKKFGKGSKEASEYGKAMAKAYQVNKGVMPKAKKSSGGASKIQTTKQQQTPTTPTKPRQQRQTATSSSTPTKPKRNEKAAKIASSMKRDVDTRTSQRITDAMKRDVDKRQSSGRSAATKPKRQRGSGVKRTGKKLKMFNLTAMLRELGGADPKTGRRKKN